MSTRVRFRLRFLRMLERLTHFSAPALLVVVLALLTAAPAVASPNEVVRDCADDGFVETEDHSRSDLRKGEDRIPADLDAYSDCRAQIDAFLSKPQAGVAGNDRGFPGSDGTGGVGNGTGAASGSGGSGSAGAPAGPLPEGEGKEAVAAAERTRQKAREATESLLGNRQVDPGTANVFEKADTANGLSLPVLLALIALTLLLAAGAVAAVRRRHPEFLTGTLRHVTSPRGLGSISLRRRR